MSNNPRCPECGRTMRILKVSRDYTTSTHTRCYRCDDCDYEYEGTWAHDDGVRV